MNINASLARTVPISDTNDTVWDNHGSYFFAYRHFVYLDLGDAIDSSEIPESDLMDEGFWVRRDIALGGRGWLLMGQAREYFKFENFRKNCGLQED